MNIHDRIGKDICFLIDRLPQDLPYADGRTVLVYEIPECLILVDVTARRVKVAQGARATPGAPFLPVSEPSTGIPAVDRMTLLEFDEETQ